MENIYSVLALCGSTNLCARTDTVFFPISEVSQGTVSLFMLKDQNMSENNMNLAKIWRRKNGSCGACVACFFQLCQRHYKRKYEKGIYKQIEYLSLDELWKLWVASDADISHKKSTGDKLHHRCVCSFLLSWWRDKPLLGTQCSLHFFWIEL